MIRTYTDCPTCDGSGLVPDKEGKTFCPNCGGSGDALVIITSSIDWDAMEPMDAQPWDDEP